MDHPHRPKRLAEAFSQPDFAPPPAPREGVFREVRARVVKEGDQTYYERPGWPPRGEQRELPQGWLARLFSWW